MTVKTKTKPQREKRKAKPAHTRNDTSRRKPVKAGEPPTADLLERVSDGFVAFDAQMNYTYVNKKGAELLGRKPADLIGKNYWVEYPEAKGTPFANAYQRALETQQPILFEDYYEPFDRWFENRIYPSKEGLAIFFTEITERKRAEMRIRTSEERLTRIVETVPDGIVIVDREGAITFANPSAERILGLTRTGITQRSYNDPQWKITAVNGGSFPDEELPFARVKAGERLVSNVEHAIVYPDGRRVVLSINASPLYGEGSGFDGMVASITDITEHKLAEILLIGEKKVLEMIAKGKPLSQILDTIARNIEAQSDGLLCTILLLDPDGVHVRHGAAPSMKESFIRAIDGQPIGPNAGSCGTAAYRKEPVYVSDIATDPLWVDYREVALNHGLRSCWSTPIKTSDGRVLGTFAMYYGKPRLPGSSELRLIDLATDLAGIAIEHRQAEEALRKNEQTFSVIFNKAPFAAGLAGISDGRYLEVNEEFERVFGFSREEIIGRTSLDLGMYPDPQMRARSAALFREQGYVHNLDMRLQTRNDTIHDVLINSDLVEIGGEKYILTTANDITERRRAEEMLQRNEQVLRLFVEHSPAAIAMFDREMKYIVASRRYLIDYELGEQNVAGRSHYEIFPEIPERWKEIHKRCLAGATEKAEDDPFPRASGKLDWIRWEIRPWYEANGEIGGIILFSEVITERKRAEEDLKKRYKELGAIYISAQHLQKLLSPDTLAREAIEVLEAALDYTFGAVLLVDEAAGTLEPFALSSQKQGAEFMRADREYIRSKGLRLGVGVTGWVAEHGESVRLGDVRQDERYYNLRDNINSELCVPMRIQDRVIGVVNVESSQPAAYSADDQRVLETIAAQIAVAIQNARLLDELRLHRDQLAELSRKLVETHETESRAIGRELHDQFGQMLTALKLTLEIVPQLPHETSIKKLAQAQELVDDLMKRVSRLSLELRPPMLDDLGILPALLWHINRYQEQTEINVEFRHSGIEGKRFGNEIETTIYRLAQEAMTNVARHARATRIRLEVRTEAGWMNIQIEDNGVGFDPQSALAKNRGLGGMRERVRLLGGSFQIESQPGAGAQEFIQLPLREETT